MIRAMINEVNNVVCTMGHYSFGIRAKVYESLPKVYEFLSKVMSPTQGYEFLPKIMSA